MPKPATLLKSLVLAWTASLATSPTWAESLPPTRARPCEYVDTMPAYLKFADRTKSLPPDQRAAVFSKEIAARYPDYYAPEVFGDEAKLRSRAERFFTQYKSQTLSPELRPLTDEHLTEMGNLIGPEFLRQQSRFIQTFKDFQCQATVEFGVSLLRFDGHPTNFGGKEHLLFGVEMIAALHDTADMSSFFDHEIFHIYHKQVVSYPAGDEPAWVMLWAEGLATYVSQRMNPGLDAQQVLWFPRDMVTRMKSDTRRAAGLLLKDLDTTGPDGDRWFLMDTQIEGLPQRAGYYLGYLFAKSVGDGVDLPALARMPLQQIHEEERTFLRQLSRP